MKGVEYVLQDTIVQLVQKTSNSIHAQEDFIAQWRLVYLENVRKELIMMNYTENNSLIVSFVPWEENVPQLQKIRETHVQKVISVLQVLTRNNGHAQPVLIVEIELA